MSTIEIQFDKKFDNSRVMREVDLRCRHDYICITLLGAVFMLGTLFYAWQQYKWIQYGYEIAEAQQSLDRLTEEWRALRIERASLASPARIEELARSYLGMETPGPAQYLTAQPPQPAGNPASGPTLVALDGRNIRP
jgi:cell division protein FtsL